MLYTALAVFPVGFLAIIVAIWQQFEKAKGAKTPVSATEKFLRAPGNSIFKKVENLTDDLDNVLFWITCFPALLVISFLVFKLSSQPKLPYFWQGVGVASIIAFVYLAFRIISLLKELKNRNLGYRGERAVGEYLNQLMLDGYRVFHDFPLYSDGGNLDHIVVGPSGVYAIETKTLRKPTHSSLLANYKVTYDGKKLQFPTHCNVRHLDQAIVQADVLRKQISKDLGLTVPVKPVLTLPGWYVETKARGEVQVLNHKNFRYALVTNPPTILSAEQIEKVAAYLDSKCRDMEF